MLKLKERKLKLKLFWKHFQREIRDAFKFRVDVKNIFFSLIVKVVKY